jgi:hypothetical protein
VTLSGFDGRHGGGHRSAALRDGAGLAERIQRDLDALQPAEETIDAAQEAAEQKRLEILAMVSLPGWTEGPKRTWTKPGCGYAVRFSQHRKQWRPDNAPFTIRRVHDDVCMGGNNTLEGAELTAQVMDDHVDLRTGLRPAAAATPSPAHRKSTRP